MIAHGFPSVCTEEAHLFAEAMSEFKTLGASVIGISADTPAGFAVQSRKLVLRLMIVGRSKRRALVR
jgi:peroxiredoxin